MDHDIMDVPSMRPYQEVLIRLRASPVWQMDRRLFWYVIKHLPQQSALDTLADMTHRRLRLMPRPRVEQKPMSCVLEAAATTLRCVPIPRPSNTTLPTLDQIERHLRFAHQSLPAVHASVLAACIWAHASEQLTALKLELTESVLHRYHTQARSLLRCYPWLG